MTNRYRHHSRDFSLSDEVFSSRVVSPPLEQAQGSNIPYEPRLFTEREKKFLKKLRKRFNFLFWLFQSRIFRGFIILLFVATITVCVRFNFDKTYDTEPTISNSSSFLTNVWSFIGKIALIVIEDLETISIATAGIVFIIEASERQKRDQYEAWQVIYSAAGHKSSGGRIQALQDLNNGKVSLKGIHAPGAVLSGIQLPDSRLQESDLRDCQLVKANLCGSSLALANLSGADLSEANLDEADLGAAILTGARLRFTHLDGANLSGTNLSRSYLLFSQARGALFVFAILSQSDLRFSNFSNADLEGANLHGAYLGGVNFSNSDLSGADLSNANLTGANLSGAKLARANLSFANLSHANFINADLEQANLLSIEFDQGTILPREELVRANNVPPSLMR